MRSDENRTRKRRRKRNYQPKCRYKDLHFENNFFDFNQGESAAIKQARIPQVSLQDDGYADKTSAIGEFYSTIGDFCFYIPEELLIEVLLRLPLKSFACFKCVSKQWQRLILKDVPLTNAPKIFIFSRPNYVRYSCHLLDNKTHVETFCSPMDKYLLRDHKVKAHSSCHGFLLIQIDNGYFMWNPLTIFFRKVLTYDHSGFMDRKCQFLADLCFDSFNDEYKVVLTKKNHSWTFPREDIYRATCGTNSWVTINVPGAIGDVFPGPFFKGYRHWLSKGRRPSFKEKHDNSYIPPPMHIVYFDPRIIEFIDLPMPQPKGHEIDTFLDLGVLDGCLCVTRWDDLSNYQGNIELLVMKEYENEKSWEVMFVLLNTSEFRSYGSMEPLFQTKEGEIWMKEDMYTKDRSVKAYDIHGNFLRDIWVSTKDCEKNKFILYEEISPSELRFLFTYVNLFSDEFSGL